jgi:hypothetical protein
VNGRGVEESTSAFSARRSALSMPASVSSLDSDVPSPQGSDDGYDSEEEYLLAQQEWEESLEQLQQLVSIVIMPFVGRYFGRKLSFWGEL